MALSGPPFGDQRLGDLGLALQPGQPRLLVHASHLLPGGQSRAHDRDDVAVGGWLHSAPAPRWGSRSRPARISERVMTGQGPLAWPRVAWQSAHISTVNRPSTLLNGPELGPRKEQRSAIVSRIELTFEERYGVRCDLSGGRAAVRALPHGAPRRHSACPPAPRHGQWLPSKAAEVA